MKSLRINQRITLLSIAAILTVVFLIPSAWARSTRYCVETQNEITVSGDMGSRFWFTGPPFDPNGLHIRDSEGEGEVIGDINTDGEEAKYYFTDNLQISYKSGKAQAHGTQLIVGANVTALGRTGNFEGSTNGRIFDGDPPVYEFDYIAFGSGGFAGMKLFQTCYGIIDDPQPPEVCAGFILDPHGTIHDRSCP